MSRPGEARHAAPGPAAGDPAIVAHEAAEAVAFDAPGGTAGPRASSLAPVPETSSHATPAFDDPSPAALLRDWAARTPLAGGLAVAVSGGSDSLALLVLLAEAGLARAVYTVDHELRPESVAEARMVAVQAARLGLPHRTLAWRWDGRGNLAEAARQGRYRALAEAGRADGWGHCALGHTRGDNVECLMLGLIRGAGLDGLCGMRAAFTLEGVTFHRPLLAAPRAALRAELRRRAIPWADDPGNEDPSHERARIRQALAALALPEAQLARSVAHLAALRRALGEELLRLLDGHWRAAGPDLLLDLAPLARMGAEFRRRTLSAALRHVSGAAHGPRGPALARAAASSWSRPATLHGCVIRRDGTRLRLSREAAAVAPSRPAGPGGGDWDRRWRLIGPGAGAALRALGREGLAVLAPKTGPHQPLPRATLLAAPSVWRGGVPVFCPFTADPGPEARLWRCDDLTPGLAALISGQERQCAAHLDETAGFPALNNPPRSLF